MNSKVKIYIKVFVYGALSILAQHYYHLFFEGSGGGIAVLVFTLFDIVDDDISILQLLKAKDDNRGDN